MPKRRELAEWYVRGGQASQARQGSWKWVAMLAISLGTDMYQFKLGNQKNRRARVQRVVEPKVVGLGE